MHIDFLFSLLERENLLAFVRGAPPPEPSLGGRDGMPSDPDRARALRETRVDLDRLHIDPTRVLREAAATLDDGTAQGRFRRQTVERALGKLTEPERREALAALGVVLEVFDVGFREQFLNRPDVQFLVRLTGKQAAFDEAMAKAMAEIRSRWVPLSLTALVNVAVKKVAGGPEEGPKDSAMDAMVRNLSDRIDAQTTPAQRAAMEALEREIAAAVGDAKTAGTLPSEFHEEAARAGQRRQRAERRERVLREAGMDAGPALQQYADVLDNRTAWSLARRVRAQKGATVAFEKADRNEIPDDEPVGFALLRITVAKRPMEEAFTKSVAALPFKEKISRAGRDWEIRGATLVEKQDVLRALLKVLQAVPVDDDARRHGETIVRNAADGVDRRVDGRLTA